MIKKIIKKLTGNQWEVRRCCWPYPDGYATFNPSKNMVLDTGLTKQEAQERCDELNAD
jgi:hypothetical protein